MSGPQPGLESPSDIAARLLDFQRKLQSCKSQRDLVFLAANESLSVLDFHQAVVWDYTQRGRISVDAVSGLVELSPEAPYVQWLSRLFRYFVDNAGGPVVATTLDELPDSFSRDGADWVLDNILHCVMKNPDGRVIGGLLFTRAEPFEDGERAVAQWLAASVGFALWAWHSEYKPVRRMLHGLANMKFLAACALLIAGLAFVPVRLNAIAPAEITPSRPIPITSPMEGVVDRVNVRPNQEVKADELLVVLEDTSIRNRLAVVMKGLESAKADLQRAINKSFSDDPSKAELNVLDARVREKAAEAAYLGELLKRLTITAPQGGLAIFSDSEEWKGRPVQPGERIMIIADPSLVEVSVYLPPDDAVQLEQGGEVTVFLNIDPLSPLKAKIVQTSYETITMPDSSLAYVVKATLEPGSGLPRIGLRGSAKVYAEQVRLGYYLMRKPILFLRRSFGL